MCIHLKVMQILVSSKYSYSYKCHWDLVIFPFTKALHNKGRNKKNIILQVHTSVKSTFERIIVTSIYLFAKKMFSLLTSIIWLWIVLFLNTLSNCHKVKNRTVNIIVLNCLKVAQLFICNFLLLNFKTFMRTFYRTHPR